MIYELELCIVDIHKARMRGLFFLSQYLFRLSYLQFKTTKNKKIENATTNNRMMKHLSPDPVSFVWYGAYNSTIDARTLIGNLRLDLLLCYPKLVCVPASFDSVSPWPTRITSS